MNFNKISDKGFENFCEVIGDFHRRHSGTEINSEVDHLSFAECPDCGEVIESLNHEMFEPDFYNRQADKDFKSLYLNYNTNNGKSNVRTLISTTVFLNALDEAVDLDAYGRFMRVNYEVSEDYLFFELGDEMFSYNYYTYYISAYIDKSHVDTERSLKLMDLMHKKMESFKDEDGFFPFDIKDGVLVLRK